MGCILPITKKCNICNIDKDIAMFDRDKKTTRSCCKLCRKIKNENFEKSPKRRWKKFLKDAERRSLTVSISYNDFLSFSALGCFYCGEHLDRIRIDRVDNVQPYSMDNLVSSCVECNFMKHSMGVDKFLLRVDKISSYQNKRIENNE